MNNLDIKKSDTVVVLSGKDKGKKGKILSIFPADNKVLVEGVNIVKRHTKPRRQGDQGGIIRKESPIYACKVMRICPKCGKPTRTGHAFLSDGSKVRQCKKCGDNI